MEPPESSANPALIKRLLALQDHGRIDTGDMFYDSGAALSIKKELSSDDDSLVVLGISFTAPDADKIIDYLQLGQAEWPGYGLYEALRKKQTEDDSGRFIGYDILGIQPDTAFHSFHCHQKQTLLRQQFGASYNCFSLIENCKSQEAITNYFNSKEAGAEPALWFMAKVKLYE